MTLLCRADAIGRAVAARRVPSLAEDLDQLGKVHVTAERLPNREDVSAVPIGRDRARINVCSCIAVQPAA